MNRRSLVIIMMTIFSCQISLSQIETNYQHCDCKEVINYSENDSQIKNGEYLFTCQKFIDRKKEHIETEKKDGLWTVHNKKGILISEIEYSEGRLNGKYDLYFYEGEIKLKAQFVNNKQISEWKYLNKKRKGHKTRGI